VPARAAKEEIGRIRSAWRFIQVIVTATAKRSGAALLRVGFLPQGRRRQQRLLTPLLI
jgi:hypothetical protein